MIFHRIYDLINKVNNQFKGEMSSKNSMPKKIPLRQFKGSSKYKNLGKKGNNSIKSHDKSNDRS